MKVFSYILALYMMVLFLIPCADMYEKHLLNEKDYTKLTQHDGHEHTDEGDLCTPFCLCGCCGMVSGVVLQWNVFNLGKINSFDLSKPDVYYKSIYIPHYFGKIWQPPKINA